MEFIDEHPVVSHRVRFADRVDITETDATHVRDGAVIVWIVETVCQPPAYSRDGEDGRCRFNIQKVRRAGVLAGDLHDSAVAWLDNPHQGRLVFDAPLHPEPEPDILFAGSVDNSPLPLDDRTEVVGSVYGPGHRGETQNLLRETWGEL